MPRTLDLLMAQLAAQGITGGGDIELVAPQPFVTGEIAAGASATVEVPLGVPKVLIKSLRVSMVGANGDFEVEVLSAPDGLVEYASLIATDELYDTMDIPYVCYGESKSVVLRIKPQVNARFEVNIRGLKLR